MHGTVLDGLDFANTYIDDAEVDTATSFPQHISELKQVLERLRKFKINARQKKAVDFVCHRVGGDRIQPREALVQAIIEYPRQQTWFRWELQEVHPPFFRSSCCLNRPYKGKES